MVLCGWKIRVYNDGQADGLPYPGDVQCELAGGAGARVFRESTAETEPLEKDRITAAYGNMCKPIQLPPYNTTIFSIILWD